MAFSGSITQTRQPGDETSQFRSHEERIINLENRLISLEVELKKILYAAPAKPREGMFAVADGVTWNPGGGAGLYRYTGGAWVKL